MILECLSDIIALPVNTILKIVHPDGRSEFRIMRHRRLHPYTSGQDGAPCDREVSPHGVHSVGPIFQDEIDAGVLVSVATKEEAAGRKFSYDGLGDYAGYPNMALDTQTKSFVSV